MDLETKDTNELESILVDELIGRDPMESNIPRDENIKKWVNWVFKSDEVKKKFREEHQEIWLLDAAKVELKPLSWLDYYKGVLIKEIRDAKLKKLINDRG